MDVLLSGSGCHPSRQAGLRDVHKEHVQHHTAA